MNAFTGKLVRVHTDTPHEALRKNPADRKGGKKHKYAVELDDAVQREGYFDLKSPKPLFFTNFRSRTKVSCSPACEWQLLQPHFFLMFRRNLKGRCSKFHPVIVNSAGIEIKPTNIVSR